MNCSGVTGTLSARSLGFAKSRTAAFGSGHSTADRQREGTELEWMDKMSSDCELLDDI